MFFIRKPCILNEQKKYVLENIYASTDIIKVSTFQDLDRSEERRVGKEC